MNRNVTPVFVAIVFSCAASHVLQAASSELIASDRIRTAATRGVKQLQHTQAQWFKTQSCTSCHHSAMPTLALMAAREHGIRIDESTAAQHFVHAFAFLSDLDLSIQASQIDPADGTSVVVAASAAGLARNTATAASARVLASRIISVRL